MKWFRDVRTSAKLFIGFGVMLVLLGVVTVLSYHGITRIQENERGLFERQ